MKNFQFLVVKFSIYLNRRVSVMPSIDRGVYKERFLIHYFKSTSDISSNIKTLPFPILNLACKYMYMIRCQEASVFYYHYENMPMQIY